MALASLLSVAPAAFAAKAVASVEAQQSMINGKVVDASGQPIIGAAILVKGTTKGTTTDLDGNFSLSVANGTALEVSCIGYVTKTVSATNPLNVVLDEDTTVLEEAVAIGYGSVKKSNLTSAVASMNNESIEDRPMARAEQALQGQLAGVSVLITNAEPGADPQIRVRGTASISAGNNPLYVIDGVPQSSMTGLNPNDIANITPKPKVQGWASERVKENLGRGVVAVEALENNYIAIKFQGNYPAQNVAVGDLDPSIPGLECIAQEDGGKTTVTGEKKYIMDCRGNKIGTEADVPGCKDWIWWDADNLREMPVRSAQPQVCSRSMGYTQAPTPSYNF